MARPHKVDWEEVEKAYEAGERICDIARRMNINPGSISNKAKELGWTKKREITRILKTLSPENVQSLTSLNHDFIINVDEIIQRDARNLITAFIEIANMSLNQTKEIIKNCPDGLYIKSSTSSGVTYERTTNFIKDLLPIMNSLNAYIGLNTNTVNNTNVQVNTNSKNEDVVQFYIPTNQRDSK